MKICLINQLFYPDSGGGAETVVKLTLDELKRLGHDVFIISCGKEYKITTEENIYESKIYRVGFEKYFPFQEINQQNFITRFFWRINQFNNQYSFNTIYSILKKEKPDLILSHNILGFGYNILEAIKILNIKHIHTIHDIQLIEPSGILLPNSNLDSLKNKIYSIFTKNIFRNIKKVVSPSEILLKLHLKRKFFPFADTCVIRNPITMETIDEMGTKTNTNELNLLYLGLLEEHKGINTLIKAFKKLSPDKFNLTIAGRGKLEEKVKNISLTMNNVNFFGEFNKQDEKELLKNADLVIVPSICFENSPMVIYEAMKYGTPIVASRIGGIPEIVINEENGYLFNVGDSEDLKNKLNSIYENKAQLKKIKDICIKKSREYSIENYIKNLLRFSE